VYFSFFTLFSVFAIFHPIQCVFLIFHDFQFSCFTPVPRCVFPIFYVFHCFPPYSRSYHVSFSFSSFISSLTIFQVLQCVCLIFLGLQFYCHFQVLQCTFLIFHVLQCFSPLLQILPWEILLFLLGQFSRHIPVLRVSVSHFACFSVFLSVFQGPIMCNFHFPLLSVFLPQLRS
jgi:hypothetical protein